MKRYPTVDRNKKILKAQKYSEKVFNRLTSEFLVFLPTITEDGQIDNKLQELNDKWLAHCERTPEMTKEGKNEFLRVAGEMMRGIVKLKKELPPTQLEGSL